MDHGSAACQDITAGLLAYVVTAKASGYLVGAIESFAQNGR
jgi:hypothetical protein